MKLLDRHLTRRLITIPALILLWAVVWVAAPLLLSLALVVDSARWLGRRTPWMAVRLVLFLMAYTAAEVIGLTALAATWVVSGGGRLLDLQEPTFAIQQWWAGVVLTACRRIFGLEIAAAGLTAVSPAPFVLIARHASIVDNLLPAWFISRPHGTRIRYVMKRELLLDPALDVAGRRLPNVFIRRDGGEAESDVAAIRRLAEQLPDDGAILIYPEGTRYSVEKRDRLASVLARRSPRLADRIGGLTHVLPPRPAGTSALLEGCQADVVVMVHRGLDGFARVADIWRGAMVRRRVEIEFWRIPRSDIPAGRSEQAEWLFDVWSRVDRWVGRPA
ncbi:MAG TPA: 1-acyl-sn-glycerol-3-phosphate acyltransferase [Acidimicrobiia bacterium]|nr:1-acyl-sn-glycerol-3-phosphate acyltransferase [Acidimicrobiia bacterium]